MASRTPPADGDRRLALCVTLASRKCSFHALLVRGATALPSRVWSIHALLVKGTTTLPSCCCSVHAFLGSGTAIQPLCSYCLQAFPVGGIAVPPSSCSLLVSYGSFSGVLVAAIAECAPFMKRCALNPARELHLRPPARHALSSAGSSKVLPMGGRAALLPQECSLFALPAVGA